MSGRPAAEPVGRRVGENDPRAELLGVLEIHQRVGCDDDHVAHLHLACRGAVQAHAAAVALAFDRVGLETLSVVDVHDLDLLAFDHIGGFHERLVDGDAAHVVQVGLRDRYAVDLRFDDFNLEFHDRIQILSIKRISPACTAMQPWIRTESLHAATSCIVSASTDW